MASHILSELDSSVISIPTWDREYGQLKSVIISVGDTRSQPAVTKEKAEQFREWLRENVPEYFYRELLNVFQQDFTEI